LGEQKQQQQPQKFHHHHNRHSGFESKTVLFKKYTPTVHASPQRVKGAASAAAAALPAMIKENRTRPIFDHQNYSFK
jgi:hypothetical protein